MGGIIGGIADALFGSGGGGGSSTSSQSEGLNLQDVSGGQPIVGNKGPVTINTSDSGAIAAGMNVASGALNRMADTTQSSLMGMGTISSTAMSASLAAAQSAMASAQASAAESAATSRMAMDTNSKLALQSNSQMGNLSGSYLEKAADLTMKALDTNKQVQTDSLLFAQDFGQRSLKFAYDAGRPEASVMQSAQNSVMWLGIAMAVISILPFVMKKA